MEIWYASTRDRAQAWSREQLINTAQKENPVFHHAIKGIMFYDETSFVSIDIVWGLNWAIQWCWTRWDVHLLAQYIMSIRNCRNERFPSIFYNAFVYVVKQGRMNILSRYELEFAYLYFEKLSQSRDSFLQFRFSLPRHCHNCKFILESVLNNFGRAVI
jgi:hypothetical protein